MTTERFTFPGHAGDKLAARLDLPNGPVLATALFAHCFTCGKDIAAARRIAARLTSEGIAVLRFDFTGLGHSEGEFGNTTFTSNAQDLVAAARALADRTGAPSLLIGHSLGGAAVLAAAADIPSAKAIVTLGAPSDPHHVTRTFEAALEEIETRGKAEVRLAGRPITIGRAFVRDTAETRLKEAIAGLDAALLVLHSPVDATVGIENASDIFLAARHPKSFVTLDDADHLVTRPEDADYAAAVIAAWSLRYLDLSRPAPPPGVPEGVTRVTEADPKGFLQDIETGAGHHMQADEPASYGGTNLGPSPYGLVAAGLGACTSMTIRMYARRKGWPLSGVSVDVRHDKVHGQDAGEGAATRLDRFHRSIRLEGSLDTDQRDRLMEIADKCPVHKTLESVSHIVTVLEDA